jgi:hypothetical protein
MCRVYVTFIEKDGTNVKLAVSVGDDLLSIAQEHDIEMEGTFGLYLCSNIVLTGFRRLRRLM